VVVGAFGKHPSEPDHLPGLGLSTEALRRLKQQVYDHGFEPQIAAWRRLDADRLSVPWGHTCLHRVGDDLLLSRYWPSSDAVGRADYPMVLCIHARGWSVARMLGPVLDQVVLAEQSLKSGGQPAEVIELLQEDLRAAFPTPDATDPDPATFHRIVRCPALVENQALARVVCSTGDVVDPSRASPGEGRKAPAFARMRVPLCAPDGPEAIERWEGFFTHLVGAQTSLALVCPDRRRWVDLILGDAPPDVYYCFRAGDRAIPPVTRTPAPLSAPDQAYADAALRAIGDALGKGPELTPDPEPDDAEPSAVDEFVGGDDGGTPVHVPAAGVGAGRSAPAPVVEPPVPFWEKPAVWLSAVGAAAGIAVVVVLFALRPRDGAPQPPTPPPPPDGWHARQVQRLVPLAKAAEDAAKAVSAIRGFDDGYVGHLKEADAYSKRVEDATQAVRDESKALPGPADQAARKSAESLLQSAEGGTPQVSLMSDGVAAVKEMGRRAGPWDLYLAGSWERACQGIADDHASEDAAATAATPVLVAMFKAYDDALAKYRAVATHIQQYRQTLADTPADDPARAAVAPWFETQLKVWATSACAASGDPPRFDAEQPAAAALAYASRVDAFVKDPLGDPAKESPSLLKAPSLPPDLAEAVGRSYPLDLDRQVLAAKQATGAADVQRRLDAASGTPADRAVGVIAFCTMAAGSAQTVSPADAEAAAARLADAVTKDVVANWSPASRGELATAKRTLWVAAVNADFRRNAGHLLSPDAMRTFGVSDDDLTDADRQAVVYDRVAARYNLAAPPKVELAAEVLGALPASQRPAAEQGGASWEAFLAYARSGTAARRVLFPDAVMSPPTVDPSSPVTFTAKSAILGGRQLKMVFRLPPDSDPVYLSTTTCTVAWLALAARADPSLAEDLKKVQTVEVASGELRTWQIDANGLVTVPTSYWAALPKADAAQFAQMAKDTPSDASPATGITPPMARKVCAVFGCDLPTPGQRVAALESVGSSKGVKLRGDTLEAVIDRVRSGSSAFRQDLCKSWGSFNPEGKTPGREATDSASGDQGRAFFEPTPDGPIEFRNLAGNVAEWVANGDKFSRFGQSAFSWKKVDSAEELAAQKEVAAVEQPARDDLYSRYFDVGFRLAFPPSALPKAQPDPADAPLLPLQGSPRPPGPTTSPTTRP
jgi:hypothetical protein